MSHLKNVLLSKDLQELREQPEFESLNLQTHETSTDQRSVHIYWSMVSSESTMQQ
jgi:alkyl hydroperoxide reductase subunit AhpC